MDIIITAPKHANQESLKDYYTNVLSKKYSKYPFVKKANVKIDQQDEGVKVSISLSLEKGKDAFAKHMDPLEESAFKKCLGKLRPQIEKYKQVHYHSS